MVLSLKTERLKRYAEIVGLLVKYGRSDLVKQSDLGLIGNTAIEKTGQPKAEELASDLEGLGPTFIKLGQLLSTRGDLLPQPYLDALSRLQDRVKPFPFQDVQTIVEMELKTGLNKAFKCFEPEPMAAASPRVPRTWIRLPGRGRYLPTSPSRTMRPLRRLRKRAER